jgi:hypothetical protein
MGLDYHGAALVALARQQGMPIKSVLTLGRLDSLLTEEMVDLLGETYGGHFAGLGFSKEPYAEAFFHRLGAERVESIDHSDYQGCSICHDLNELLPAVPDQKQYDLVYDGGTLEHVFHFPNAIANCMALVKNGGAFMCSSPADKWLGHGFYQFSPELFFRVFSEENGFEMVRVFLAEGSNSPGRIYHVTDPAESGTRTLLKSRREMVLLVWAKKKESVKVFAKWPQQSDYVSRWQAKDKSDGDKNTTSSQKMMAILSCSLGHWVPQKWKDQLAVRRHWERAKTGLRQMDKLR